MADTLGQGGDGNSSGCGGDNSGSCVVQLKGKYKLMYKPKFDNLSIEVCVNFKSSRNFKNQSNLLRTTQQ